MGRIIAQAADKVGETGSTVVEESQTLFDEIEFTEGLTIDRGYISPYFVKDQERQIGELVNPRILVTDAKIDNVNDVVPILEQLVKSKDPLLIIAEDVTGEALSALVVNKMRGVLDVVAIKAPGFGNRRREYTQDIAIATGASFVAEELGITLDSVTLDMLGTADRVVVAKETTTIVTDGKHQEDIDARISQLRRESDNADTDFDKDKFTERIASLGGGIARIKVGAATETELKDKKLRYEDALNSVQSARELGIVPGGGACLAHIQLKYSAEILDAMENDDERSGAQILLNAMGAPCMQVAENAGIEGAVVLSKVQALGEDKGVRIYIFQHCVFAVINSCFARCIRLCSSPILHTPVIRSTLSSAGGGTLARWNTAICTNEAFLILQRSLSMPLKTLPVSPDLC
jgi:chaperonin GroEL